MSMSDEYKREVYNQWKDRQYAEKSVGWWIMRLYYEKNRINAFASIAGLGVHDIVCETVHEAARHWFAIGWNLRLIGEYKDGDSVTPSFDSRYQEEQMRGKW